MNKVKFKEYLCFVKAAIKTKRKLIFSGLVISAGMFLLNTLGEGELTGPIILSTITMYCLLVISIFSDFTFLHRREEINYYLGKPTTLWSLVKKNIITNFVLWLAVLFYSMVAYSLFGEPTVGTALYDVLLTLGYQFLVFMLCVVIGALLTTSVFSGNLASIVVYAIPLIIAVVLSTHASLIIHQTQGFISSVFPMSIITYVSESLYTISFVDFDIVYLFEKLFYLTLVFGTIYTILRFSANTRRNENESNGFTFTQVQVMLTVIVSAFFAGVTTMSFTYGDFDQLTTYLMYIITFYLVYFVATMVLDLRFKITKRMVKNSTISVVGLVVIMFLANIYLASVAEKLPTLEDIEEVEIATFDEDFREDVEPLVLTEKDDIEKALNLHIALLSSDSDRMNLRGNVIEFSYELDGGFDMTRSFGGYNSYNINTPDLLSALKAFREDKSIQEAMVSHMFDIPEKAKYVTMIVESKENVRISDAGKISSIIEVMKPELASYIGEFAQLYDIAPDNMYYGYISYFDLVPNSITIRFEYMYKRRTFSKVFYVDKDYFENTFEYIDQQ